MIRSDLLYKELSYKVQGVAIKVRRNYGPGHKESIYDHAFEEILTLDKIPFEKQKRVNIYSPISGKVVGSYVPDYVVDGKIIIELKAHDVIPKLLIDQLYNYLRNSKYELGYLINFGGSRLYIKRIIYTNKNKPWVKFSVYSRQY